MKICVDSSSLGTYSSLVVNLDGSCQWQNSPTDCIAYLGSDTGAGVSIKELASIQGISSEKLELGDSAHTRSFEILGVANVKAPWAMVLGRKKFTARLKQVISTIQGVVSDPEVIRYVETYRQGNEFLKGLQRPRINTDLMRSHRTDMSGGLASLAALTSFTPGEDGLAPAVTYDRTSTSTGRLIVSAGPKVLTLQKECRDIIGSRSGGSIYEVDFVSLEPRVALNIMGETPPRDIYEGVKERMGLSTATRSAIKQAVISALYGSSSSALAEALGGRREAQNLVREVKEYFQVSDLVSRLNSHMSQHSGRLHNYFGRPLIEAREGDPESKLVSHYVQSSAVDVSLLGFKDLLSRLESQGIAPIYVIHDAVLLDVPRGCEELLQRECAAGVDLEMGHFELGLKRVSQ